MKSEKSLQLNSSFSIFITPFIYKFYFPSNYLTTNWQGYQWAFLALNISFLCTNSSFLGFKMLLLLILLWFYIIMGYMLYVTLKETNLNFELNHDSVSRKILKSINENFALDEWSNIYLRIWYLSFENHIIKGSVKRIKYLILRKVFDTNPKFKAFSLQTHFLANKRRSEQI